VWALSLLAYNIEFPPGTVSTSVEAARPANLEFFSYAEDVCVDSYD
jgi:hypothetical protein